MKLYIYILLLVLLIIYINRQSNYLENFVEDDFSKHHYDNPDSYNILKTDKVQPIFLNTNSNEIPGFNPNDYSIYSNKYWLVKNKGFSDIYNYEDLGGAIIYDVANGLDTDNINTIVIKEKIEKPKDNIYNKITDETIPTNISYQNANYHLLGTATNVYYKQYFYIFENLVEQKLSEPLLKEELKYMKTNIIFQYLLVKMHNGKPKVIHWIGPRNKINLSDVVYLSLGSFQLGPLVINKIS